MKATNIIYWVTTILICALMLFSAVGSFMSNPQGDAMLKQLGYQHYVMHLLAILKVLGVIALLTPGFPRIKEWAYAGFTFDLLGALYSMIAAGFSPANWALIPVFIIILAVSYICWHKRMEAKAMPVGVPA